MTDASLSVDKKRQKLGRPPGREYGPSIAIRLSVEQIGRLEALIARRRGPKASAAELIRHIIDEGMEVLEERESQSAA